MSQSSPLKPESSLTKTEESKVPIPNEILSDIIENILFMYERNSQQKQIISIPRPVLSLKPLFLSDFAAAHNLSIFRTLDFIEKTPDKKYHLKHMEVHKQHVYNLCGYHALFNLIEICKLLKSQDVSRDPSELLNPANFWKFRFDCMRYLDKYAEHHKHNRTKYPWQDYHIRWGDLERAYVKPLTADNEEFRRIVASDSNFKISHFTFEFQFNRILFSAEGLERIQQEITEFKQAYDKPVHHVKMIMMGITNHWFLFFAHRYKEHVEFWMLDSKNTDYLQWKKEEIDKFLEEYNEKKKLAGQPVLNSFRLWVAQNAMLDSQISVDLLANCFLGNTTLSHFIADSEIRMLRQGFMETFLRDPESDIMDVLNEIRTEFQRKDTAEADSKLSDLCKQAGTYVLNYYTTFKSFFTGNKADFLYAENRKLLNELVMVLFLVLENSKEHQNRYVKSFRDSAKNVLQSLDSTKYAL